MLDSNYPGRSAIPCWVVGTNVITGGDDYTVSVSNITTGEFTIYENVVFPHVSAGVLAMKMERTEVFK